MRDIKPKDVALVFTDELTGQGYVRKLSSAEEILVLRILMAHEPEGLSAIPVEPVKLVAMRQRTAPRTSLICPSCQQEISKEAVADNDGQCPVCYAGIGEEKEAL